MLGGLRGARANSLAALSLATTLGLAAAVLSPPIATAGVKQQASPRPVVHIYISAPAAAAAGTRILVAGRTTRAPVGSSIILQRQAGKGWLQLARTHVVHGRFKIAFVAPSELVVLHMRALVVKKRRRFATSTVLRLTIRLPIGVAKGFGPIVTASSSPSPSAEPLVSTPITVTTEVVRLAVGSVIAVAIPAPLVSVTSVGGMSGAQLGVAAVIENGVLTVSAEARASTGTMTLTLNGTGCTASECDQEVVVRIPVTVVSFEAPPGPVESFTEPSPDRVAAAVNDDLTDELLITVGSPEAPGTRAEAEAAASQVEGVVAGGLEASGIYQIRWGSSQNLETRKHTLEEQQAVTSVSQSSVGLYTDTGVYPIASEFESPEWTWPYTQVHAEEAWEKSTGSDVTVGVIDGGDVYKRHEDLNVAEVIGSYDPEFHATHVAGLACAKNNAPGPQLGMVGIAWGCPIVSDRVEASNFTPGVLNAMHSMAARASVKVVNISLGFSVSGGYEGGNCADVAFQNGLAARLAEEKGIFDQFLAGPEGEKIVWTFSAGNNCAPGAASPWGANAQLPNVITVAATNSDESLAHFSNYGSGVKVAAPGGVSIDPRSNGLMSTATDYNCPEWDSCTDGLLGDALGLLCRTPLIYCGAYHEDSGTSMAAPIVAGIAALVRSKSPAMSADEAGACITSSAGTAGSGETAGRSDVPYANVYKVDPNLPQPDPIPIANAAAAVECIPRRAALSYSGSGGGDGWALALSSTAVYNVFHHDTSLQIACHNQIDASPCWEPETITDAEGNGFASSGQPGLWLDQTTGRLYVFATRTSDQTAGVVCINTSEAASNPDPFCGFTALTGPGEASSGISGVSDPALVGSRWYAFNYVRGAGIIGDENKLLCFDLRTFSACPGQPFSTISSANVDEDTEYPPPAVVVIGTRVLVPLTLEGTDQIACFEGNSETACSGTWPVQVESGYDSGNGAAYPLLSSGSITGFCLPTGIDPCFSLTGEGVDTPSGMTEAIQSSSGWNGPSATLGTRVYVPNGDYDQVDCYDYAASATCSGYPRSFENLGLLYTVTLDPERSHCIWVNSDDGTGQIQNFDAYSGGACE
jgi:hypothetical protein